MAEYVFKSETLKLLVDEPKLIMDFMDMDSDKWGQYASASSLPMSLIYRRESRLLAKYENKIFTSFDISILISEEEAELFQQKNDYLDKPIVIGNGIDVQAFYPAAALPGNPDPVLLFTGVMDYKPNVDAVIWFTEKVWPMVLEKYANARLIVAGMNPVPDIARLANRRGVEITGMVESILPYYHQADIFIAPLLIARGVQNKVLQAFACGVPVVATSMGAEGIDCKDTENILIADAPEDFFARIEQLCSNPDLYLEIRDKALNLVRDNYSWAGKLELLSKTLQSIQGGRRVS
jgi:sugar transferase (PEP-CTERM/EpsH1 system associated)